MKKKIISALLAAVMVFSLTSRSKTCKMMINRMAATNMCSQKES